MKAFRVFNIFVALAMAMALVITVQPAAAQEGGEEISRDSLYVPGEVIVGFTSGRAMQQYAAEADALAVEMGGQVVDAYARMALLSFAEEADVPALAEGLGRGAGVAYAEPNYISWIPEQHPLGQAHELTEVTRRLPGGKSMTISMEALRGMRTLAKVGRRSVAVATYPSEQQYGETGNWGWWYTDASIIWPNTAASPTVCVVDTGIDTKHLDFAGQALNGYDFVNEDTTAEDDNGHGTHVAGIVSAKINNGKGLAGISNGKVLGVKVLSSQGWGTAFDIAQGIIFCANQTAVKVINMSLGGSWPSLTEYEALNYAINTKGKFVAAAAGNDSRSHYMVDIDGDYMYEIVYFYPAAWASQAVCRDGLLGPAGWYGECDGSQGANENTIDTGLISVGAGRSLWSWTENDDQLVWVDVDGDGVGDAEGHEDYWNEHEWVDYCATDFTNYGYWVQLVAPGQDISSTVPVSYPYWNQAYENWDEDHNGYEWVNGTSQATPHVAGAAARVWSIYPTESNSFIKNQLWSHSWALVYAWDPNIIDPSIGYTVGNGYKGEAPFCWPDDSYNAEQDMSFSGYLDVAFAMGRGAITGSVSDAVSGLPLNGATVTAVLGTTTKATATVNDKYWGWFDLINLPAGYDYTVKVNKTGYTSGAQAFDNGGTYVDPGYYNWTPAMDVGIPPSTRLAGVVNWGWPWDDSSYDLDLFVWLPVGSPGGGGVVGPWDLGRSDYRGAGELSDFPRARWNRDGGSADWMGLESISIVPRTGFTTYPWYNITPGDYYDFILVDYADGDDLNYNQPVFRMWVGGKILSTVVKSDVCGAGEDSWRAGYMNLNTFTGVDDCGPSSNIPPGVWPYDNLYGTSGIPEYPYGK